MSWNRTRAQAHRLVLASLTGNVEAFEAILRELDPQETFLVISTLSDACARLLLRHKGSAAAIQEVENLIINRLDDMDRGAL
jgi:hypothetical protein